MQFDSRQLGLIVAALDHTCKDTLQRIADVRAAGGEKQNTTQIQVSLEIISAMRALETIIRVGHKSRAVK